MPLTEFHCSHTPVFDLSPLKQMPLTVIYCNNTNIADLSALHGTRLTILICDNTPVSDLSPLAGMSLKEITFTPKNMTEGIDVIRQMESLEKIGRAWNEKRFTPTEFWKRYDDGEFGTSKTPSPAPTITK